MYGGFLICRLPMFKNSHNVIIEWRRIFALQKKLWLIFLSWGYHVCWSTQEDRQEPVRLAMNTMMYRKITWDIFCNKTNLYLYFLKLIHFGLQWMMWNFTRVITAHRLQDLSWVCQPGDFCLPRWLLWWGKLGFVILVDAPPPRGKKLTFLVDCL